jgi:general secretion pathway protein H
LRAMAFRRVERALASGGGFTLLEIMMVMVLVLIILGISTVFFSSMLPSQNLNAAGRELSAMLRFARLLAKTNGETRTVFVDLETGRYGIEGVQTRRIPQGITVKITDALEGEITRGRYSISFSESGQVTWERITLSAGKRILSIELDPVLGAVVLRN